jgi:glutamate dehydrogenase
MPTIRTSWSPPDKGTATFSDIANGISAEYSFWLGDAFASGGSAGYDHKKMGITARGAWESVKRHFREMGVDTQSQDFTVVGIGDMSGDVFGNGMLLSSHIKLLAAFDHRHIFIDPSPDPARSFAERERMFNLPRSSWEDYDKSLISKGGGVFPRTQVYRGVARGARGARHRGGELAPAALMKAILRAPADLLYNGGIGTYVKATHQSNREVGDRANDAIRVNGSGPALQGGGRGRQPRLHAARARRIRARRRAHLHRRDRQLRRRRLLRPRGQHQDPLGRVVEEGEMTLKQRNALLAEMTDEVAALVLSDNYYQTQSLAVQGCAPTSCSIRRRR